MTKRLFSLLAVLAAVAALALANVRLAATDLCEKDCGCGEQVREGESPDLACPYQQMCKFTECSNTKTNDQDCVTGSFPTYLNQCVTAKRCGPCPPQ